MIAALLDELLPPHKRLVRGSRANSTKQEHLNIHTSTLAQTQVGMANPHSGDGASSILALPGYRAVSGGRNGSVSVVDVRFASDTCVHLCFRCTSAFS